MHLLSGINSHYEAGRRGVLPLVYSHQLYSIHLEHVCSGVAFGIFEFAKGNQ